MPSRQEVYENRCNGTGKGVHPGCLPRRVAFSMLCPAGKRQVRTGAMELGKVLTPESRLLHVVPGGQEAGENSL